MNVKTQGMGLEMKVLFRGHAPERLIYLQDIWPNEFCVVCASDNHVKIQQEREKQFENWL